MLFSLNDTKEYGMLVEGQNVGEIQAFYIDTDAWKVRYLVVKMDDRNLLIPTRMISPNGEETRSFQADVSRELLMNSPEIDIDRPLSRQLERSYYDYYGWPYDWDDDGVPNTLPGDLTAIPLIEMELERQDEEAELIPQTGAESIGDTSQTYHTGQLFGYTAFAMNDEANSGTIHDAVVNYGDWRVMYLVVDLGGILPGKKGLISPSWVREIDVENSRVMVDLKRETIQNSPEYRSAADLDHSNPTLM